MTRPFPESLITCIISNLASGALIPRWPNELVSETLTLYISCFFLGLYLSLFFLGPYLTRLPTSSTLDHHPLNPKRHQTPHSRDTNRHKLKHTP